MALPFLKIIHQITLQLTVSVPSFLTGTMHDFDKSLLKFRNSYRKKV